MGMSLETATTEWLFTLFAGCVSDRDSLLVWDLFFIFGPYAVLKISAECLSISLGLINKFPSNRSYSELSAAKKQNIDKITWELIASEGSKGLKERAQAINIRHIWINNFQDDMLIGEDFTRFMGDLNTVDQTADELEQSKV